MTTMSITATGGTLSLTHTAPYRGIPMRLVADENGIIRVPVCDLASLCGIGNGHRAIRTLPEGTLRQQTVGTYRGDRSLKTLSVVQAVDFVRKHSRTKAIEKSRWLAREAVRLDAFLHPLPPL